MGSQIRFSVVLAIVLSACTLVAAAPDDSESSLSADAEFQFHESIVDGDRVVLVWSFSARSTESDSADSRQSWGGMTLFRFDREGKISEEVGEESAPGPAARLEAPDPE